VEPSSVPAEPGHLLPEMATTTSRPMIGGVAYRSPQPSDEADLQCRVGPPTKSAQPTIPARSRHASNEHQSSDDRDVTIKNPSLTT
jgi:hypothetical protein